MSDDKEIRTEAEMATNLHRVGGAYVLLEGSDQVPYASVVARNEVFALVGFGSDGLAVWSRPLPEERCPQGFPVSGEATEDAPDRLCALTQLARTVFSDGDEEVRSVTGKNVQYAYFPNRLLNDPRLRSSLMVGEQDFQVGDCRRENGSSHVFRCPDAPWLRAWLLSLPASRKTETQDSPKPVLSSPRLCSTRDAELKNTLRPPPVASEEPGIVPSEGDRIGKQREG